MTNNSILVDLEKSTVEYDDGVAYIYRLSPILKKFPNNENLTCVLFEDLVEIGPRNSYHSDIRKDGGGSYSFYGDSLWFSATDNSNPKTNSKKYTILVSEIKHLDILDNDGAGYDQVNIHERISLAKKRYRQVLPQIVFPDYGRLIELDRSFANDFNLVSPEADYTLERKFSLKELFKLASDIPGDVAECGVYKGATIYFLATSISKLNLNKKICLFDSFEGLSTPEKIDSTYWHKGDLKCSKEGVLENLKGLDNLSCIEIYAGWIPEKFSCVNDRIFCFVHIDVDLAKPTRDSLEFFYPRMSTGGIMIFDDYGFFQCPGVTDVVDNFLSDKPEPLINLASGGAFFIKREPAPPLKTNRV